MKSTLNAAAFWIVLLLTALYCLNKQPDDGYTKGLENIAAACLSDASGRLVTIGDTHYLCGIVEIGKAK